MNFDLKKRILKLFADEGVDAKDLVTLMVETTLEDGTVVGTDAEAFAEGVSVWVVVDGEQVAAPDGTHTLIDGMTITTEGGVVVAVGSSEEMSEETTIESRVENMEKSFAELKGILTDMLSMQEAKETELTEAKEELEKVKSEKTDLLMAKAEAEVKAKKLEETTKELGEKAGAISLKKETPKKVVTPLKKGASLREKVLFNLEN